jgi:NADH-quinone oxidoreductase subunit A
VNPYVPIVGLAALAAAFAVFSVVAGTLAGPKRYNKAKLDSYECGIQPTPQPVGGGRFPIKYYLTAMTFIIFDIEIIFLFPWAVRFRQLGLFGLVEMAFFIGLVFVAYVYIWRTGGLDWAEDVETPAETEMPGEVMAGAEADLEASMRDPEVAGAR